MRYRKTLALTLLIGPIACTTTMNSQEGWVYQAGELSPQDEGKRFDKDLKFCSEKRQLAEQTNRDYDLDVDPQGAFELCMRSKGWQPASEVSSVDSEEPEVDSKN